MKMKKIDLWIYRTLLLLAIIGLVVSAYMTVYKLTSNDTMCLGSGDCHTVNSSRYSEIYGIPARSCAACGASTSLTIRNCRAPASCSAMPA